MRYPSCFLSKALLASDLLLWLFWLPVTLRIRTLPILLKHLARNKRYKRKMPLKDAVGIVMRLCNLRPFRSRIFPKRCLRQSLTLYRTLSQMGYPVEIHFGVHKDGDDLKGHSWVTIQGKPIVERTGMEIFKSVYSQPSVTYRVSVADKSIR
jgi:Transglutaminase-like superfamily